MLTAHEMWWASWHVLVRVIYSEVSHRVVPKNKRKVVGGLDSTNETRLMIIRPRLRDIFFSL